MSKRKIEADYRKLAESRNWEFISGPILTVQTLVTWRCDKGHTVQTTFNRLQTGWGCHICANALLPQRADYARRQRRKGKYAMGFRTYRDMVKLGLEKGFIWCGIKGMQAKSKTAWKCDNHHIFHASYEQIKRNHRCPDCPQIRKKRLDNLAVAIA